MTELSAHPPSQLWERAWQNQLGHSKYAGFDKLLCVIGDGGFLMNVQDLQTIHQDKVNVIISIVNNNGYLAIRNTQKEFLGGRLYGTRPEWKLEMPSIERIAAAFEIPYVLLDRAVNIDSVIENLIGTEGPIICEVLVDESQDVLFKQGYKNNGDGTYSPQDLSDMVFSH
jgi:acetolactate synthase I/II/III large subunit